jgi:hypothetical protein
MERCSICVLPLHLVKHNRQKVCIHCQTYRSKDSSYWQKRQEKFQEIIHSFSGKGNRYDFLVPLTGGKDSTYVLHYLTRVLGQSRVLTFTWDHLFHRQGSWTNMEKGVAASGVDFYVFRILDVETTRAIHRGFFRIFGHTCLSCYMLRDAIIMNQAIRHGIPLIVTGANPGQARTRGTDDLPGPRSPAREAAERMGTISYFLNEAARKEAPERREKIVEETIGEILPAMRRKDFQWPFYVDMGAFIDWYRQDETSFLKTLSDSLHFQKPSNTVTHTSCWLERLRGYQEYNIGKIYSPGYTVEISNFIRDGILTREEGLLELEKFGMTESLPEESRDFIRELGISPEEFKERLNMPLPQSVKFHFAWVKTRRKLRNLFSKDG